MSKKFRVKDSARLREIDGLPYALRLMMSLDAIRAAIRWLSFVERDASVAGSRDLIICLSTGMGWCAETFRTLTQGICGGYITQEMVGDSEHVLQLWRDVTAHPRPPLIRKFHCVRDKFFGHWDETLAKAFIERQARGEDLVAFIESDGEGESLRTRYPWGQAALAFELIDDPKDIEGMRALVRRIGEVWGTTEKLVSNLVASLVQEFSLEFEPDVESE